MQEPTEKDLRIQQLRLIVIVVFVIFAFMLVYTIYWSVNYNEKYGFFVRTRAEVVEHKEVGDKLYDVLAFEIDGNEYRVVTDYESQDDIGDKVIIYYDESNPLGIIYDVDIKRYGLPILTAIFGIASGGLAVVYVLIDRSNKKVKVAGSNTNFKSENLKNSYIPKNNTK